MGLTERIRELCDSRHMSIRALERACGLGNGTVKRWTYQRPNAMSLQRVAEYFGVTSGYLLGQSDEIDVEYYIDPEVRAVAQGLKDRPELKILFDASKDLRKEDIEFVLDMIERMR